MLPPSEQVDRTVFFKIIFRSVSERYFLIKKATSTDLTVFVAV